MLYLDEAIKMSVTLNGKTVSDRGWVKPRNYMEMIEQTRELKKEINYQLKTMIFERKYEKQAEEKFEKFQKEQKEKTTGFSQDMAYCRGGNFNFL